MLKPSEYFIYAVLVDAPDRTLVKLGRASSLRQRLNDYATACPYAIRCAYACDVIDSHEGAMREAQMHELYADRRMRGEWFDMWGRVAADRDIRELERNIYDIARDRLADAVRHSRYTPAEYAGGKTRMVREDLDGLPPKLIMEDDGYPVGRAYIASMTGYPVTVIEKPRRRLFPRC